MRGCALLTLLLLGSFLQSETSAGTPFTANVGRQRSVFPDRYHGLRYFPDEPICIFSTRPWVYTVVAHGETVLMKGPTLDKAVPVKKLLTKGEPSAFDNGYVGLCAYYRTNNGNLLGFCHCEDHTGLSSPTYNADIKNAYCSVALVTSSDGGETFDKVGPIITGQLPKGALGESKSQGVYDVSVETDPTQTFLYAYYGEHSRVGGRGVVICMARCRISDGGRPGAWYKFHNGRFEEEGLGGRDSPVVPQAIPRSSVISGHVKYIESLKQYVMICCVQAFGDHERWEKLETRAKAKESGIYIAYSGDGIQWSTPELLFVGHVLPYNGLPCVFRPALHIAESNERSAQGFLLYGYSSDWGVRRVAHHLVRRPIRIRRAPEASDDTH